MGNIVGLLFGILVAASILYTIIRGVYQPAPRYIKNTVSFRTGVSYDYILGDNLPAYAEYGRYNGLDISLPIEMPHIYLDSVKAGGREVAATFSPGQRITLEGDFANYFNVFVPQHYEVVALSILSPDVMETLEKYASLYDVEIYGWHLRVISNKDVLGNSQQSDQLLEVADKILREIEQRAASWTTNDGLGSIDQDLLVYANNGFRLSNHYFTWHRLWFSLWWLFAAFIPFMGLAIYFIYMKRYALGIVIGVGACMLFGGLQYMTASNQAKMRFWSRRG